MLLRVFIAASHMLQQRAWAPVHRQSHAALMLFQQTSWPCPEAAQAKVTGRLPDGHAFAVLYLSFVELSLTRHTSCAVPTTGPTLHAHYILTESLTPGLLQVAHKIHTLRVELYENAADYVRLTLEVLLTLGIGYTVFIEFKAIFMTHMKTVSLLGAAPLIYVSPAGCYRQCFYTMQTYHTLVSAVTGCMNSRSWVRSDSPLPSRAHHHQQVCCQCRATLELSLAHASILRLVFPARARLIS